MLLISRSRYTHYDLRVRLGEWDVNHDVEFYPHIERDVVALFVHPEFYAGTLFNDLAILRLDKAVDFNQYPHISPACLPDTTIDFSGQRCWTTGWGKDAFGESGKYQNILKVGPTYLIACTCNVIVNNHQQNILQFPGSGRSCPIQRSMSVTTATN